MNRRDLMKRLLAVPVLGTILLSTACSVYNDIMNYVPLGLQVFNSVIQILQSRNILPQILPVYLTKVVSAVTNAFNDIKQAVSNYLVASAANQPSLLGKITAALQVAEEDVQEFWSNLNIPDASVSSLVEGLLGLVVSTLMGFATQLPTPVVAVAKKTLAKRITVAAKHRSPSEFKKEANALYVQYGFNQYVIK